VDDHARGLVDDCDVLVLVNDVERDRLSPDFDGICLRNLELDDVTSRDTVRRVRGVPVDQRQVAFDEASGGRAAEVRCMLGQEPVQPGRRGGGDQPVVLGRIK
jgi:hypothetical protein